jgi:hypothetical protein
MTSNSALGVRGGRSPQAANLGSFAGRWNTNDWGVVTFTQNGKYSEKSSEVFNLTLRARLSQSKVPIAQDCQALIPQSSELKKVISDQPLSPWTT